MHAIVTGATGLLGHHVIEQLAAQGWSVTALVRETSNRASLGPFDVKFQVCDLGITDPDPGWFRGADVVFHAAAAVTEWAPWSYFLANTIQSTERLCRAMVAGHCPRLVHVSSVAVYGTPTTNPVKEDYVPRRPGHWNYYRRSKIAAEQIVREHSGLKVSIIRPAMMYGPSDRGLLARVIELLRQDQSKFVGDPKLALPLVHAHDVARAAILAATTENAIGQAFNVVSDEKVSQADFLNTIASLIDAPPVTRRVPYRLAYAVGFAAELWNHLIQANEAPPITRYRIFLVGHRRHYSADKIRTALGWRPEIKFQDGIREAVRSYRKHEC